MLSFTQHSVLNLYEAIDLKSVKCKWKTGSYAFTYDCTYKVSDGKKVLLSFSTPIDWKDDVLKGVPAPWMADLYVDGTTSRGDNYDRKMNKLSSKLPWKKKSSYEDSLTDMRSASEIFRTAMELIRKFIADHSPRYINIDPATEDLRKLYHAMVRRYTPPGYRLDPRSRYKITIISDEELRLRDKAEQSYTGTN